MCFSLRKTPFFQWLSFRERGGLFLCFRYCLCDDVLRPPPLAPRFTGFTVPARPTRDNRNGRMLYHVRAVRSSCSASLSGVPPPLAAPLGSFFSSAAPGPFLLLPVLILLFLMILPLIKTLLILRLWVWSLLLLLLCLTLFVRRSGGCMHM